MRHNEGSDTEEIEDDLLGEKPYRTVLGFDTRNKTAGRLIDAGYVLAVIAALYYAYHGFSSILGDEASMLMTLVISGAVVLLPYAIKIAMFGQKSFPIGMMLLCLFISTPPMLFDFFGMYAWSGGKTVLGQEKAEALEVVNTFNVATRRKIAEARGVVEQQRTDDLAAIAKDLADKKAMFERRLINARHLAVDEAKGVPGADTTGQVGRGQQALIQEAAARRESDMLTTNMKQAEAEAETARTAVNAEADARIAHLDNSLATLGKLVAVDRAHQERDVVMVVDETAPAVDQIADADSFEQLGRAAQRANSLMATSAAEAKAGVAELTLDVKDITAFSGDIFEMSVLALSQGKIAAWVSLLVAFLLEMADSIIAFGARYVQGQDKRERRTLEAAIHGRYHARVIELEASNAALTERNEALEAWYEAHAPTPHDEDGGPTAVSPPAPSAPPAPPASPPVSRTVAPVDGHEAPPPRIPPPRTPAAAPTVVTGVPPAKA